MPSASKFPLAVEFLPRADGLLLHVLYAADRYLESTVERIVSWIVDFLVAIGRHGPGAPLSEFTSWARPAAERFARFQDPTVTPG
ncbi:hypothetical protein ACWEIJ_20290 [Lentzea sp. NPDC004789]